MAEKHFYGTNGQFKGSMDDSGRFYDEKHFLMGHVENGTIYDDCNIPRGHIDSDGRVTDMCNIPTGKEFGANFVGWGGHGSGYVRNDVLGTGHGNDYGVFEQLDRSRRRNVDSYSYNDDDNNGSYEEDYDEEDYGEENYGEDDDGDWDDSFTPEPAPRHRRRRNDSGNTGSGIEKDIGGCFDALGGCLGVIFGLVLLYQLIKYLGT